MVKWRPFVRMNVVNYERYKDKEGALVLALYQRPQILFMYPHVGKASMIVESGKRSIWVSMSIEELKILKRDIENFFEARNRMLELHAAEGLNEMFSRIEERESRGD